MIAILNALATTSDGGRLRRFGQRHGNAGKANSNRLLLSIQDFTAWMASQMKGEFVGHSG
jgi:hypothetical protein